MSNNQFTGTATQPQRNRKLCQFNKDQYCIYRKRERYRNKSMRQMNRRRENRGTDNQTYRLTDADIQSDILIDRLTDRQTGGDTEEQRERYIHV